MNNIFRNLGFITTIILAILGLSSCNKIRTCEIKTQDAQKESVQLNDLIYNRVFGSKSCSPQKLILRLPANLKIENHDKESIQQQYTPNITTFVTFSKNYENFDIIRIDRYTNKFIYSPQDSCLSWKWSMDNENKQKILNLSMERNLQIRDRNIKSIIFIVSLPVEMKEAGVQVNLKLYTLNKDTSRVGAINRFRLQKDYRNLNALLRQKARGNQNFSEGDGFKEGKEVSQKIAEELTKIAEIGGIHIEEELYSKIDEKYKLNYSFTPEYPSCKIPPDLE